MRTIEYYGHTFHIADYQPQHRYCNQAKVIDGIAINPNLRPGFDDTPNDLRDIDEINDWWGNPYILVETLNDIPMLAETWATTVARHQQYQLPLEETRDQFDARQTAARQKFLQQFPDARRYTVRCLDGGAHDRSTWCGEFASLAEAVQAAKRRQDAKPRY